KILLDAADSEHVDLGFKSHQALDQTDTRKREAAITVSSFANGTGGIVVYGVEEAGEGRYKIGAGFPPDGKVSKDFLVSVLDSQIQPYVQGLRVFRIEIDEDSGNFVLLAQIPRAEVEPHQAPDKVYYVRRDGHKAQMSHQEVKDAFFRARYPNLQVEVALVGVSIWNSGSGPTKLVVEHDLRIKNVGGVMASDYLVRLSCEPDVFRVRDNSVVDQAVHDRGWSSVISSTVLAPDTMFEVRRKIFPGQCLQLGSHKNAYSVQTRMEEPLFEGLTSGRNEVVMTDILDKRVDWSVYADNAPPKSGSFRLRDIIPPFVVYDRDEQGPKITIDRNDEWPKPLCLA
ncbi:MAG: putative DNA binding domain-containing protein, partial [Planctomycetes bacterium]|nr:putative DNA binding domain-containing protein [Planctomycetota bacterium]